MIGNFHAYFYQFQFGSFLFGFLLFDLFFLLIKIFAEVYYPSDRRIGLGRYFHQIKIFHSRHFQRFRRAHDSQIFSMVVDQSQLGNPYLIVYSRFLYDNELRITNYELRITEKKFCFYLFVIHNS